MEPGSSIFTIDLNKALDRHQEVESANQKVHGDDEDAPIPMRTVQYLEDYDNAAYVDDDEEMEDIEEDWDEEEEKAERLQFFKERRFSVFPIAWV